MKSWSDKSNKNSNISAHKGDSLRYDNNSVCITIASQW